MEKEEHTAMSVHKTGILSFLFLFCICAANAQENLKTWGFIVFPGLSKSDPAAAISYPDPPFYVDLKVTESLLFSFKMEIFKQTIRKKNWVHHQGLGFSTYNYIVKFDYDHSASVGNNFSDRHSFHFLYYKYSLGKTFCLNKLSIAPYGGLSLNYLVAARTIYEDIYGVHEFNELQSFNRWNVGYELGVRLMLPINQKYAIFFQPAFTRLIYGYGPNINKLYSYDVGIGVRFRR